MWPLAVLTGDRINGFFFLNQKKYGAAVWRGRKKVAAITRWPKAGFHRTSDH